MDTKDIIRKILEADPSTKFAKIATELGVSRQRVHQIAVGLGYPRRQKQGLCGTERRSEYQAWHNMIARCTDTENANWSQYGGRGIRVCERWLRSFDSFFADMGARPSASHSIDRIRNEGHYEPRNCRWATRTEQMQNTRQQDRSAVNRMRTTHMDVVSRIRAQMTSKTLPSRAARADAINAQLEAEGLARLGSWQTISRALNELECAPQAHVMSLAPVVVDVGADVTSADAKAFADVVKAATERITNGRPCGRPRGTSLIRGGAAVEAKMQREPTPVQVDQDGTKWWNWLYEYDCEGDKFGFSICARSQAEADARLKRLPLARYIGQQDGQSIPFARGGFMVPLIVWWRNLRRA